MSVRRPAVLKEAIRKPPQPKGPNQEELENAAQEIGVPLHDLAKPEAALSLLEQLRGLERKPAAALKQEFRKCGFAAGPSPTKEELLPKVRDALLWESLAVPALCRLCKGHQLPVTDNDDRDSLMLMLQEPSWDARGVPLRRLSSPVVAHGLLDQLDALERRTDADLATQCRKRGLAVEAEPSRAVLLGRLRKLLVWDELPLDAIQEECVALGVPTDNIQLEARHKFMWNGKLQTEDQERKELVKRLIATTWDDIWKASGLPVDKLGRDASGQVYSHVESLQAMNATTIHIEYKKIGIPPEPGLSQEESCERIRKYTIWQHLPVSELRRICEERCVADTVEKLVPPNAGSEAEKQCELAWQLHAEACVRGWEEKGFPVRRFGDFEVAAKLADQCECVERMNTAAVTKKCTELGIPVDKEIQISTLVAQVKKVMIWEAFPLAQLWQECETLNLPVDDTTVSMYNDDEQRSILMEHLLMSMCERAYEARQVPVERLGSVKLAAKLAQDFERLECLRPEDLQREYAQLGVPKEDGLQKQEILTRVKDVALWKVLPVAELLRECGQRGLEIVEMRADADEKEQRAILIDELLLTVAGQSFEKAGIPITRLGSIKAATKVLDQREKYKTANPTVLMKELMKWGVNPVGMQKHQLVDCLNTLAIWMELPLQELQKDCVASGLGAPASEASRIGALKSLASVKFLPVGAPPPRVTQRPRPPQQQQEPSQQAKVQQEMRKLAKFFNRLGLMPGATLEEVKKAYRVLALKYHPDKNLGTAQDQAADNFRSVNEAYELLCNHMKEK